VCANLHLYAWFLQSTFERVGPFDASVDQTCSDPTRATLRPATHVLLQLTHLDMAAISLCRGVRRPSFSVLTHLLNAVRIITVGFPNDTTANA
jgi:hypothetical protein